MTHSSIMPLVSGRRQYVYCANQSRRRNFPPPTARNLWQTTDWKIKRRHRPLALHSRRRKSFLSGGYNASSILLQLSEEAGRISVKCKTEARCGSLRRHATHPVFFNGQSTAPAPTANSPASRRMESSLDHSGSGDNLGLGSFLLADGIDLRPQRLRPTPASSEATQVAVTELARAFQVLPERPNHGGQWLSQESFARPRADTLGVPASRPVAIRSPGFSRSLPAFDVGCSMLDVRCSPTSANTSAPSDTASRTHPQPSATHVQSPHQTAPPPAHPNRDQQTSTPAVLPPVRIASRRCRTGCTCPARR